MKVGIDAVGFYTPHYCIDLKTLAKERSIDENKIYAYTGVKKMAIVPPNEDIVTMATNAALQILPDDIKPSINMVLFATESGIDQSKAAGIYVHKLLKLSPSCRVIELKQACYAATFGLQIAMSVLKSNPHNKILLIASDVARYELNSSGEYSQGAGAIAMLLTSNPRLLAIEDSSGFYVEDVMDFWRPNYRTEPLVYGKYSCGLYLRMLEKTWQKYSELSGRKLSDHQHFCYHVPVPRLVEKAHRRLLEASENDSSLQASLNYSREVGNCYTASLYISLLSLLENSSENLAGHRVGLYSYGSGCSSEYFSAVIQPEYQANLKKWQNKNLLAMREELSFSEYIKFYKFTLPIDGGEFDVPQESIGEARLKSLSGHKRIYEIYSENIIC